MNKTIEKFNNSTSFEERMKAMNEISRTNIEQTDKYNMLKTIGYIAAGIYAVNLLDALIFTPVEKELVIYRNNNKFSYYPSFWYNNNGYYFSFIVKL